MPAYAGTCPEPADRSGEITNIVRQLTLAPNEGAAAAWNAKLWEIWLDAPDALSQTFLDRGMAQRSYSNFVGALANFDALINYCPDYAEGYNQRAFAYFLQAKFDKALVDLDKTLSLSPRHIGALSGKALTLMGLERDEEAQEVLREALKLNPWLSERRFLKDGPKEPGVRL
ncbi:tetratricopeptide repeat protein [Pseudaestuariivita atlantica]|nr:tetratricopeptide repeat protein [Pseudaestuariivita atlantica]